MLQNIKLLRCNTWNMEQCIVLKMFSVPHLLFFTEKQAANLSVLLHLTKEFHKVTKQHTYPDGSNQLGFNLPTFQFSVWLSKLATVWLRTDTRVDKDILSCYS